MYGTIVGGKCIGHDTSIFVLREGEKPFALDRERVTRFKHDIGFPYEPLEMAAGFMGSGPAIFSYPDRTCSFRDFRIASDRSLHSKHLPQLAASAGSGGLLIQAARMFRNTYPVQALNFMKSSAIVSGNLNKTIKRRKPYQPFCPSVLESERPRLFERTYQNKHMTCAFRLKERWFPRLGGGAHVDGTARPQFVEKADNPSHFRLISRFKRLKGYGFIINTSFNLHGRPDRKARMHKGNSESSMASAVAAGDERVLAVVRARYSRVADILAANGMKSVLEIGCSVGFGSNLMRERDFSVRGIDSNPESIRTARRLYPGMDFRAADASGYREGRFDAVVALEVLEHIRDQRSAVRNWRSSLRKGGLLIISTPNSRFSGCRNEYHEREFSYDELRVLLPGSSIEGFDFHYITTKPVTALFGGAAALKFRMGLNPIARHFPRWCNNFLAVARKG